MTLKDLPDAKESALNDSKGTTTLKQLKSSTPFRRFWKNLTRNVPALIGLGLIVLVISLSVAAPILAPYQPDVQFDDGLSAAGEPVAPNQTYLLGTDPVGRDLLSRMLYGGQTSLLVALVVNVIAITVGTIFGLASGYFGGLVDTVLSRVVDTMLAFPAVLFAIALSSAIKPSVGVAILALSLISWTSIARVVRGQVLALKEREFILAARSVGVKNSRILIRHIIPHLISPLIVLLALTIPTTILLEATLSYLGAGVPPNVPSWGNIIQDGTRYYRTAPWIVIFPGLAIFLTVFGFNLFGEGLRDALDPRQKQ